MVTLGHKYQHKILCVLYHLLKPFALLGMSVEIRVVCSFFFKWIVNKRGMYGRENLQFMDFLI